MYAVRILSSRGSPKKPSGNRSLQSNLHPCNPRLKDEHEHELYALEQIAKELLRPAEVDIGDHRRHIQVDCKHECLEN